MHIRRGDSRLRHQRIRRIRSGLAILIHSKHQPMHLLPMEVLPLCQRDLQFQVDTSTRAIPEINTSSIQAKQVADTDVGPFSPVSL